MPKEQRLPFVEVTAFLRQHDDGAIAISGFEASVQYFGHITQPGRTLRS
jgi:hypothetical protein